MRRRGEGMRCRDRWMKERGMETEEMVKVREGRLICDVRVGGKMC